MKCERCDSRKGLRGMTKWGMPLCGMHRSQMQRHGRFFTSSKMPNVIVREGRVARIFLYSKVRAGENRTKVAEAIIDAGDMEIVRDYHWYLSWNGYAISTGKKRMHLFFLPRKKGFDTDHINENKLDNRRANLRYARRGENIANQRRIVGVKKIGDVYVPRIVVRGEVKMLGRFKTISEAMKRRREAEIKYYGRFAPTRV